MKDLSQSKNILIISAHADDHMVCAGTVFKLQAERGFVPYEIVLTDSSKGQHFETNVHQDNLEVSKMRQKELSKASKFLGTRETFLFNQVDFELSYNSALVFEIAKVIRKIKPSVVFLMGESDVHPDHKVAFRLGLEALKFASFNIENHKLGLPFRVPVVLCSDQELPDKIQVVVDVTKYLKKKQRLMKFYSSQMSPKAVAFEKGILSVRGYNLSNGHSLAAEAFSLQSEFPIFGFAGSLSDLI